jgi:small redox-active disulfide protein 2
MKSDKEIRKVKLGLKMVMDEREKVRKAAGVKNSLLASCSQESPFNIPSPYKISSEVLEKVEKLMREDVSDTVAILKVLSDPIRLRILKALRIEDLCVCVFVELMNCEYSKLSYHLRLLKEAGLIDCKKDGNFLIYYLTEFGKKKVSCFGLLGFKCKNILIRNKKMEIKILGTGCPKCRKVYGNAKKAVEELGVDSEVEKVEDIDKIISFGVMMTPAVVINGVVKASGRIPNTEEIKKWLLE